MRSERRSSVKIEELNETAGIESESSLGVTPWCHAVSHRCYGCLSDIRWDSAILLLRTERQIGREEAADRIPQRSHSE